MTAIYIICFILLVVGAALLLKLTPDQINKDISEMFDKKQSLKEKSLEAKGRKKTKFVPFGYCLFLFCVV